MRYRRQRLLETQHNKKQDSECSGNNCVLFTTCLIVVTIIILYLAFGPSIYHQQPIVIGQETIVSLTAEKQQIPVHEKTINIKGDDIYYRYALPRGSGIYTKPDVLLLHGSKYASSTWRGLGTLQIFAYYGYRTFAIDLPGYKLSTRANEPKTEADIIAWMDELILALQLKKLVLVVPSMSGKYGLPFMLHSKEPDLVGLIAIAPSYTERYTREEYEGVSIPVLIVFGERDNTEEKKSSEHFLKYIPQNSLVMIQHAEHAAFVGNPKDFHAEILRFLTNSISIGNTDEEENIVISKVDEDGGGLEDKLQNYNDDNANYFMEDYDQLTGLFSKEKDISDVDAVGTGIGSDVGTGIGNAVGTGTGVGSGIGNAVGSVGIGSVGSVVTDEYSVYKNVPKKKGKYEIDEGMLEDVRNVKRRKHRNDEEYDERGRGVEGDEKSFEVVKRKRIDGDYDVGDVDAKVVRSDDLKTAVKKYGKYLDVVVNDEHLQQLHGISGKRLVDDDE